MEDFLLPISRQSNLNFQVENFVDLLADIKLCAVLRVYVLNLTIFSLGKPQASAPLAISHFFALLPCHLLKSGEAMPR
ncbi:MAG TPA: hypothetical protein DEV81_12700 [Cyanobacteria bacterium UBA11049]|nr:hypothetical protein [Cyanobacteria bacterium UBA11049]